MRNECVLVLRLTSNGRRAAEPTITAVVVEGLEADCDQWMHHIIELEFASINDKQRSSDDEQGVRLRPLGWIWVGRRNECGMAGVGDGDSGVNG